MSDRYEAWRVSRVTSDARNDRKPPRGRWLALLAMVISGLGWLLLDSMKMGLPYLAGGTFHLWTVEMQVIASTMYLLAMASVIAAIARSGGRRGFLALIVTNALFAFSVLW